MSIPNLLSSEGHLSYFCKYCLLFCGLSFLDFFFFFKANTIWEIEHPLFMDLQQRKALDTASFKYIIDSSGTWKEIRNYELRHWRAILQGQLFYYSILQTLCLDEPSSLFLVFLSLPFKISLHLYSLKHLWYSILLDLPSTQMVCNLSYLSRWQITCSVFLFPYCPLFFRWNWLKQQARPYF